MARKLTTQDQARFIELAISLLERVAEARDPKRRLSDQAAVYCDQARARAESALNNLPRARGKAG